MSSYRDWLVAEITKWKAEVRKAEHQRTHAYRNRAMGRVAMAIEALGWYDRLVGTTKPKKAKAK